MEYFTQKAKNHTHTATNAYRFGLQGQESENEWAGQTGSHSFFKYRISDNRIGRFFAVDPLASKYPWNSTYAFSENQVIAFVELEGLERSPNQWGAWTIEGHEHAGISSVKL